MAGTEETTRLAGLKLCVDYFFNAESVFALKLGLVSGSMQKTRQTDRKLWLKHKTDIGNLLKMRRVSLASEIAKVQLPYWLNYYYSGFRRVDSMRRSQGIREGRSKGRRRYRCWFFRSTANESSRSEKPIVSKKSKSMFFVFTAADKEARRRHSNSSIAEGANSGDGQGRGPEPQRATGTSHQGTQRSTNE